MIIKARGPGPGFAREIVFVLAVALLGLLLATLAALTPWYGATEGGAATIVTVEPPANANQQG